MALTPEEVNRMEEQADLSDRFNRAADRYVAGNNPGLRAAEREQVLRGREADVFSAARQRRINANRAIAASDPGRFSAFETRSLLGLQHTQGGDIPMLDRQEREGLRAHELEVLKRQGENEMAVAHEKSYGMVHQGEIAAGISAGVNRDIGRSQHGYFDENGNYVPGSTVRAAEATGLWKSELNENNWQHRKQNTQLLEEGRDRRHQQQLDAGREKTEAWRQEKEEDRKANKNKAEERTQRIRERQEQQEDLREQRDFEAFDRAVGSINNNPLSQEQKREYRALKTHEERLSWWKKHYGRGGGDQQAQDGKPKDGDRKQFKQGWGTWKDGKWVLDAQ